MRNFVGIVLISQLLVSCSKPAPPVVNQAPDYGPVGEAFKFLGLCLLGISIICSAASIIKNIINKSS